MRNLLAHIDAALLRCEACGERNHLTGFVVSSVTRTTILFLHNPFLPGKAVQAWWYTDADT